MNASTCTCTGYEQVAAATTTARARPGVPLLLLVRPPRDTSGRRTRAATCRRRWYIRPSPEQPCIRNSTEIARRLPLPVFVKKSGTCIPILPTYAPSGDIAAAAAESACGDSSRRRSCTVPTVAELLSRTRTCTPDGRLSPAPIGSGWLLLCRRRSRCPILRQHTRF